MACYITHCHSHVALTQLGKLYNIVVISAGFLTVNTFAGYIKTYNFRRSLGKQTLLHFHGQIHLLFESHSLLEL